LQYVAMVVHVGSLIATIAVLWAMAPHVDARVALLIFENDGGWVSTGLAIMVGQLTVVFALDGSGTCERG
jgi:choline transport protein